MRRDNPFSCEMNLNDFNDMIKEFHITFDKISIGNNIKQSFNLIDIFRGLEVLAYYNNDIKANNNKLQIAIDALRDIRNGIPSDNWVFDIVNKALNKIENYKE